MISKISNLFIWWNGQTIGTKIYTKLFGNFVGTDENGNNYFKSTDGSKRWINYKGVCDASSISPAWHSWIHKTTNKVPALKKDNLSKSNSDNNYTKTNISGKYHPNNSKDNSIFKDYESWKPED